MNSRWPQRVPSSLIPPPTPKLPLAPDWVPVMNPPPVTNSLPGDIGVGRGNHNIGTRDAKDVRNDHVKGVDSDAACIAADRARLLVDDYHYPANGQGDRLVRLPGDGKRLAVDDQIGDHRATADRWASRRADSHGAGPKEVGCYGIAAGGQADIGDRGF